MVSNQNSAGNNEEQVMEQDDTEENETAPLDILDEVRKE